VRALSNAVEARDAYTGKHAERVAAYGVALAGQAGYDVSGNPQVEFGFLLHDVGRSRSRTRSSSRPAR
jgi:ribonuclease P protein subunit RPR2